MDLHNLQQRGGTYIKLILAQLNSGFTERDTYGVALTLQLVLVILRKCVYSMFQFRQCLLDMMHQNLQ